MIDVVADNRRIDGFAGIVGVYPRKIEYFSLLVYIGLLISFAVVCSIGDLVFIGIEEACLETVIQCGIICQIAAIFHISGGVYVFFRIDASTHQNIGCISFAVAGMLSCGIKLVQCRQEKCGTVNAFHGLLHLLNFGLVIWTNRVSDVHYVPPLRSGRSGRSGRSRRSGRCERSGRSGLIVPQASIVIILADGTIFRFVVITAVVNMGHFLIEGRAVESSTLRVGGRSRLLQQVELFFALTHHEVQVSHRNGIVFLLNVGRVGCVGHFPSKRELILCRSDKNASHSAPTSDRHRVLRPPCSVILRHIGSNVNRLSWPSHGDEVLGSGSFVS